MVFFKNDRKFIAVDADSIGINLRTIILNACKRHSANVLFVTDRHLSDVATARCQGISAAILLVNTDFDAADNRIVEFADNLLFCISHDKRLAERLSQKNIITMDKRGRILNMLTEVQFDEKESPKDVEKFAAKLEELLSQTDTD